ncbi:hypothetical protein B0H10DRAFT_1777765 [Mycena sp. CBHHK59/15]|nr:hypothetical protein B0H10DRAFT_1777765 [Mycena sp. CBHHK59/15]
MHASAFTTVLTVENIAEPSVAAVTQSESADSVKAVNHNGPQCCHCGWRGGSHASNCPFK